MTHNILIAEDDMDISDLIRVNLMELGVNTTHYANGQDAIMAAKSKHFDLLLLDIMLPGMNGLDICRTIRQAKPEQAIIMLTSKDSETDRVLGLELGADDYMTKPFSIRELQARVRAQLRKVDVMQKQVPDTSSIIEDATIKIGELTINSKKHQVTRNRNEIELTATEFELLHFLAKHPNHVFSRAQLLESVWGYHHSGYEHTVNSHINRLRAKIEQDATSPQMVQTVWGIGYKFNPAGAAQ